MVDKCPPEWVGGNGYFTAGAHRTVHGGLRDLLSVVQDAPVNLDRVDMEPYTRDDFFRDIMRLSNGRSNSALVDVVVDESREAIGWLADKIGVPFVFSFHRQAYEVDGRQKFWGGMVLSVRDGGKGLIRAHQAALADAGVEVWFNCQAVKLLLTDGAITGLSIVRDGKEVQLTAPSVIMAAGGFEANPEMRVKYLGVGWDKAKVSEP
jgi:succinate dehydrogenase/fumarate reductase flavoprotein subunit